MEVGIGLPNSLLDVEGPELVAWAQRAERRGFSVLGTRQLAACGRGGGVPLATGTGYRASRPNRRRGSAGPGMNEGRPLSRS